MSPTLLTIAFLAAAAASPSAPASDPRAPSAWDGLEDPTRPSAPGQPVAPPARRADPPRRLKTLGDLEVGRGTTVRYATLEVLQAALDESWTVTLDGLKVGRLVGREDRLRVGMITPGKHRLAIFNERGTLWSGRIDVRGGHTLVLTALENGFESNEPAALTSDAELREERVAKQREPLADPTRGR